MSGRAEASVDRQRGVEDEVAVTPRGDNFSSDVCTIFVCRVALGGSVDGHVRRARWAENQLDPGGQSRWRCGRLLRADPSPRLLLVTETQRFDGKETKPRMPRPCGGMLPTFDESIFANGAREEGTVGMHRDESRTRPPQGHPPLSPCEGCDRTVLPRPGLALATLAPSRPQNNNIHTACTQS